MNFVKSKYTGKEFTRAQRVSEEIKKEIAIILHYKIRDPRLKRMTVSHVILSKDLSYAKIFVTFCSIGHESIKNKLNILNKATTWIRKILGKSMQLRLIPQLYFFYDNKFIESTHIENLINNIS